MYVPARSALAAFALGLGVLWLGPPALAPALAQALDVQGAGPQLVGPGFPYARSADAPPASPEPSADPGAPASRDPAADPKTAAEPTAGPADAPPSSTGRSADAPFPYGRSAAAPPASPEPSADPGLTASQDPAADPKTAGEPTARPADAPPFPSAGPQLVEPGFPYGRSADAPPAGPEPSADPGLTASQDPAAEAAGGPVAQSADAPPAIDARMAQWVILSGDNNGLPFAIVDKLAADVLVFDAHGELQGAAPVLVGLAPGDDSAPGIGDRELSAISPEERTTPAGRFLIDFGPARGNAKVLWVDYDTSISLHPVVTSNRKERRLERLSSPDPADRRITYGCINVPADFYTDVVMKAFAGGSGVVYILPDTRPLDQVFPAFANRSLVDAAAADATAGADAAAVRVADPRPEDPPLPPPPETASTASKDRPASDPRP
jgi:hypothetical protein